MEIKWCALLPRFLTTVTSEINENANECLKNGKSTGLSHVACMRTGEGNLDVNEL